MGKQIETKISNFGGISDSPREVSVNKFQISKHFDIFTDPHKLIPQRGTTDNSTGQVAVGAFLYTSNNYLLGLGATGGKPVIYFKTGATLIADNWLGNITNWQAADNGTPNYDCFVEHIDHFYFWDGGHLIQGDIAYDAPLVENFATQAHTNVAQGLVHSANGILFLPYDNKIAEVNAAGTLVDSGNSQCPSIDADYTITAICEYGSWLAIACKKGSGLFPSKVFIWDMVATAFTDIIDWGDGDLEILNYLDGYLFGVSIDYSLSTVNFNKKKTVIRQYGGGKPQVIKEIYPDPLTTAGNLSIYQRVNFINQNRLYFSLNIDAVTGGESRCGLFCIGKDKTGSYAITLDRVATDDNSEDGIRAAIIVGGSTFMVHTAVGTITRSKTASTDTTNYAATSTYESQIFNAGDTSLVKNLIRATINHEKLPANASVALKYRVDGASAWTSHFTSSTDDDLTEFLDKGIGDYHEIEWRPESTGGAVITGFSFEEEILGKKK